MRFTARGNWWSARCAATMVLASVVVLAGCSSDGSDSSDAPSAAAGATASSKTPSPDSQATPGATSTAACNLLTDKELTELSGQRLPAPATGSTAGLPSCSWGSPSTVGVQVTSVPAAVWADQAPAVLSQIERSGSLTAKNRAKVQAARRLIESGKASAGQNQGCELFQVMLEIQGLSPAGTRTVNVVPSKADPQGISGQECSGGAYTSVLLVAPDLTGSEDEGNRVVEALIRAHERAVG
jgi:hypothetical protein